MAGPRTFRKRPTEVQALRWTGDNVRKMRLFAGDWIVCDIQRAFHPVRDDVFEEIYEIADQ